MVLERQLHRERLRFTRADQAWLAALLHPLPREAGADPAPQRTSSTRAAFLRSRTQAILAADFFENDHADRAPHRYVLAVIEHATRRIRILGATAHPTAAWVTQTARNLMMDLDDAGCRVKYLIRDRDGNLWIVSVPLIDARPPVVPDRARHPARSAGRSENDGGPGRGYCPGHSC